MFAASLRLNGLAKRVYAVGTVQPFKQFIPDELAARRECRIALFGDRAHRMFD